jgi:hypothetical protein
VVDDLRNKVQSDEVRRRRRRLLGGGRVEGKENLGASKEEEAVSGAPADLVHLRLDALQLFFG